MERDELIYQACRQQLDQDPALQGQSVQLSVEHGVVTLRGRVGCHEHARAAEHAIRRVPQVHACVQDLRFPTDSTACADAELSERVRKCTEWTITPSDGHVDAAIENGWVTLTGHVSWANPRNDVEHNVLALAGVKGVTNQISVDIRDQPRTRGQVFGEGWP